MTPSDLTLVGIAGEATGVRHAGDFRRPSTVSAHRSLPQVARAVRRRRALPVRRLVSQPGPLQRVAEIARQVVPGRASAQAKRRRAVAARLGVPRVDLGVTPPPASGG